MTVRVAELSQQLQSLVPRDGSKPTADDYEVCIRQAINDYSQRRPIQRQTTLDIVSGTASYTLPDDFMKFVKIARPGGTDTAFVTGEGIIPLSTSGWDEEAEIVGQTITFYPTPAYNWSDRRLWYLAFHLEGDQGTFTTLTTIDASIFMKKAESLALLLLANVKAPTAQEYRLQSLSERREGPVQQLRKQAEACDKQYLEYIKTANQAATVRASYTVAEEEAYLGTIY